MRTPPQQKLLALMSATWHVSKGESSIATTPIYTQYNKMCEVEDIIPLSNRRFRDRLNDLSDSNILTKTQGRGQGKQNRYELAVDVKTVVEDLLQKNERHGEVTQVLRTQLAKHQ
ncbi:Cdc6/Cdc18 family protein [Halohasta litchfieldiae]|uniref:hypothetical protein n=1 Tax=Halohasta litchfieldiae TaxID=1073996 RepID=UPI003744671E